MEIIILAITVFVTGILGIAWRRNDTLNLLLKVIMIGIAIANLMLCLKKAGYLIKL